MQFKSRHFYIETKYTSSFYMTGDDVKKIPEASKVTKTVVKCPKIVLESVRK